MVTIAGELMEMLCGTECVTPVPAQVSRAAMFVEWVTTVPLGAPQLAEPVTVTVVLPERVGSATLVAVIVYVPGVGLDRIDPRKPQASQRASSDLSVGR